MEVIQGSTEKPIDWVDVWSRSEERARAIEELEALNKEGQGNADYVEDQNNFATPIWFQFKTVLQRLMTQIWRSPVGLNTTRC